MKLLEKGLNFCPSTKDIEKEKLLDDIYTYCRKIRLKYHFNNPSKSSDSNLKTESSRTTDKIDGTERCEMKSKLKNPYFNPPSNSTPANLEKYIATTKSDITKLINKQTKHGSNLSPSERNVLKSLKVKSDIVLHPADKGGKIVVMDKDSYTNSCEKQLDDKEFYIRIDEDSTNKICDDIHSEIVQMVQNKQMSKKELEL